MSQEQRVRELIRLWQLTEPGMAEPRRSCVLKGLLYQVRNPGFNGAPELSHWPAHLVDGDDVVNAAVEHYFLCRCWVGSGTYPAWQVRAMRNIYNTGKRLGVTPRHNPDNPTTPPSALQTQFQNEGIRDGEGDLARSGRSAPIIRRPPTY